eukprot:jgi/Mesvir1/4944/Mv04569-RA.1
MQRWLAVCLAVYLMLVVAIITDNSRRNRGRDTDRTLPIPRILYGTGNDITDAEAVVLSAVRAGFRGIDSSNVVHLYDEPGVGTALSRLSQDTIRREHLFLQTKYMPYFPHFTYRYNTSAPIRDQVLESVASSLSNLNTTYFDSILLHKLPATWQDTLAAWRALEELSSKGIARHIGLSNVNLTVLWAVWDHAVVKPAIVQNKFTAKYGYDEDLREFCRSRGIRYQGFSSLRENREVYEDGRVVRIAGKHGKTPAQVFLAYLFWVGVDHISGTRDAGHMVDTLDSQSIVLDDEEVSVIRDVMQRHYVATQPAVASMHRRN